MFELCNNEVNIYKTHTGPSNGVDRQGQTQKRLINNTGIQIKVKEMDRYHHDIRRRRGLKDLSSQCTSNTRLVASWIARREQSALLTSWFFICFSVERHRFQNRHYFVGMLTLFSRRLGLKFYIRIRM